MQDRDVLKIPLESEQDFSKFLQRMRGEADVCLEQLAEGLMSASQLARIEKGQRPITKNMRDRLLGRLGVADDLYENLLNIEDYAVWEAQRDILEAVEGQETCRAQELIKNYKKQALADDKIRKQFCLVMEAELLKQRGAASCEIADCYARAVKLTVPDSENLCLDRKLLSIQEINMVLEYAFYHRKSDFAKQCMELMKFVENTAYDNLSKVKIYPKIAWHYLQEIFSGKEERSVGQMRKALRVCNQAVEMLRDTGRAFYLLELLEMKVKILEHLERETRHGNAESADCQECRELVKLMRYLYDACSVPAYMQECTYLYRQRWVFYVGDVLRIRRKMAGLTQKQLCDGICSARTLRRSEKKEANMQRACLEKMLRKLGLSKEYQRARLVTNDREVLRLRREILVCRNNQDTSRCRKLLGQIRQKISLDIPENRQYLTELQASLDWMEGKISKEEFAAREEQALNCTLNTDNIFGANEMYLTEMEILCIRKKIQGLEGDEKKKLIGGLMRFFETYEKACALSSCISMYEFVMVYLASELGNIGDYQISTELNKKILKESLACKRICDLDSICYNIMWNENEQKLQEGQFMDKEKMTKCLKQCILLSHFCKRIINEQFYNNKLC